MSPARACRTEDTCASFLPAPNHTQSAKKGKRQLRILQKRHGITVAPSEFQLGDDAAVEWHPGSEFVEAAPYEARAAEAPRARVRLGTWRIHRSQMMETERGVRARPRPHDIILVDHKQEGRNHGAAVFTSPTLCTGRQARTARKGPPGNVGVCRQRAAGQELLCRRRAAVGGFPCRQRSAGGRPLRQRRLRRSPPRWCRLRFRPLRQHYPRYSSVAPQVQGFRWPLPHHACMRWVRVAWHTLPKAAHPQAGGHGGALPSAH